VRGCPLFGGRAGRRRPNDLNFSDEKNLWRHLDERAWVAVYLSQGGVAYAAGGATPAAFRG